MSEHIPAEIYIGGRLPQRKLSKLLGAIQQDGGKVDWGLLPPDTIDELLASRKDGCLWFCDEEANYGSFASLEQYCRDNQLAYNRYGEAKDEYDRALVYLRQVHHGKMVGGVRFVSAAHEVLVPETSLRAILERLQTSDRDSSQWWKRVAAATQSLREMLEVLPSLPPFEVVPQIR